MSDRTDNLADRAVIVPARELGDLLELTSRALERMDPSDPLASALRGSLAAVNTAVIVEP